jgi:hypothetical protein
MLLLLLFIVFLSATSAHKHTLARARAHTHERTKTRTQKPRTAEEKRLSSSDPCAKVQPDPFVHMFFSQNLQMTWPPTNSDLGTKPVADVLASHEMRACCLSYTGREGGGEWGQGEGYRLVTLRRASLLAEGIQV